MNKKYACDLFGGRRAVYDSIRRAIKETRIREGHTPYSIAEYLTMTDCIDGGGKRSPDIILDIEEGRVPLTESDTFTIMGALGITIESALPPLSLDNNDMVYWTQRFEQTPSGFTGHIHDRPKPGLEMFLRFQAIKEIGESSERQAA